MGEKKTAPALILDLPGAPNTPHTIPGVPGLYRPDRATPVGAPGEVTEDQAKDLAADEGTHLKLVRVSADEVDDLREQAQNDLRAAREGQREAILAGPDGAEAGQITNERAATA